MFSIIIPTFNNVKYLKICIESIKKNSTFNHEIIAHVNLGEDGTKEYLDNENIEYTFTNYNAGICEGMNKASKKANFDFILYSHDDFYFCPKWDEILNEMVRLVDEVAPAAAPAVAQDDGNIIASRWINSPTKETWRSLFERLRQKDEFAQAQGVRPTQEDIKT